MNSLAPKLNRAAGMLAKVRHFVNTDTLRNIYFGIFASLLTYGSQVWGQLFNKHISRLQKIQNKAIRILNFANYREDAPPLYNKSNILRLSDQIKRENFLHVHKSLRNDVPIALRDSFKLAAESHDISTRCAATHKLVLPKVRTMYGINSITYQSTASWNYILSRLADSNLQSASNAICKKTITKFFIDSYVLTS